MIRLISLSVGQKVEQKGFIKKKGLEKNRAIQNKNEAVVSVFLISSKVMHFIPNRLPQRHFVHLP